MDQRIPGFKGFFQTVDIIRLAVIKAGERADTKNNLLAGDFITILVRDADALNQSQIRNAVVFYTFDEHKTHLQHLYVPT